MSGFPSEIESLIYMPSHGKLHPTYPVQESVETCGDGTCQCHSCFPWGKLEVAPNRGWGRKNRVWSSLHALLSFQQLASRLPLWKKQGPDLRHLRRAIWKGRDFLDWRILIRVWMLLWAILELRENNQILELCENNRILVVLRKLDFLAFWPWK